MHIYEMGDLSPLDSFLQRSIAAVNLVSQTVFFSVDSLVVWSCNGAGDIN